jgi:translation elongation factor EF-G
MKLQILGVKMTDFLAHLFNNHNIDPQVEKIVASLQLKVSNRDLRTTDPKQQLSAIFSQWLPLAQSLLAMVCKKLPPPTQLSEERAEKLMCSRYFRSERGCKTVGEYQTEWSLIRGEKPIILFYKNCHVTVQSEAICKGCHPR